MSTVLSSERFGGSYASTFSNNFTLGWSERQRMVVLYPLAPSKTVTLKAAAADEIPFGYFVWIIFNVAPADSFTVNGTSFSTTLAAGKAMIISKVDVAGTPTYFFDKRDLL